MSVLCCAALGPRLTRWRCWIRCLPVSLFTKKKCSCAASFCRHHSAYLTRLASGESVLTATCTSK